MVQEAAPGVDGVTWNGIRKTRFPTGHISPERSGLRKQSTFVYNQPGIRGRMDSFRVAGRSTPNADAHAAGRDSHERLWIPSRC
jgi:hypothetical protein